jgi:hypothetical protein
LVVQTGANALPRLTTKTRLFMIGELTIYKSSILES